MVVLAKSKRSLEDVEVLLERAKVSEELVEIIDSYIAKAIWNTYFAIKDTAIIIHFKQSKGDM